MAAVTVLTGIKALAAATELVKGPVRALQTLHAHHGPVVVFRTPAVRRSKPRSLILIADIDAARAILHKPGEYRNLGLYPAKGPKNCAHRRLRNGILGMNGEVHRHFRRLYMPALTSDSVAQLEDRMQAIAEAEVSTWREGDRVDLVRLTSRLVRRLSLELIFGERNLARGLEIAHELERHVALCASLEGALFPIDWPGAAHRRLLRQAERAETMLIDWVADRRLQWPSLDMITTLLSAKTLEGALLSDGAVAAQLWTLYGASFDTTAATLAWVLLLLAQHPDQGRRLLEAYRTSAASPVEATHMITEAMRLCTTAPFQAREAVTDGVLPQCAFRLNAGDHLVIAACVINRSGAAFRSPSTFHPERWEEPGGATALLTFGSGPRACPGFRFATAALHAALKAIWSTWRININEGANIDYRTSITLSPTRADVSLRPQDGQFSVARIRGRARAMAPALSGSVSAGPKARPASGAWGSG